VSTSRIKLLSGGWFDFVDMEQSKYTIEDIAHNLSMICRFNGSVRKHYSVAQHAWIVSHMMAEGKELQGLVHDNEEGVMGDMSSPLKRIMPAYKQLGNKVEAYMLKQLGLTFPLHSSVKLNDLRLLAAEIRDLQPESSDWGGIIDIEPYEKKIVPWSAKKAKEKYLERFYQLTEKK
jgi:hypothetical protein